MNVPRDVALGRGVDRGTISRREEVEEQAAGDRQRQTRLGLCLVGVEAEPREEVRDRPDPGNHHLGQEALGAAGVSQSRDRPDGAPSGLP